MSDEPALDWLVGQPDLEGESLWFCDEQAAPLAALAPRTGRRFVTNRYDIALALQAAGHAATFSDFDTRDWTDAALDRVVCRIGKEKPVVHHQINQAARLLKPGGELVMAGLKNEGAKTYLDKAARVLGCGKSTRKHGAVYAARLSKHQTGTLLDDSDYTHLRALHAAGSLALVSKPGQFGWQKVDAGSALLLETLTNTAAPARVLDLGCGYGYLALAAVRQCWSQAPQQLVLTDNNAAALISARANAERHCPHAEIVAADAGDGIAGPFDLVLCNPPFHRGFAVEGDLTERFVDSARRLLAPAGEARFVVNGFIDVETPARRAFADVKILSHNRQFKVLSFKGPNS